MLVFENVIIGLVLGRVDRQIGVIAHVVEYICVDEVLVPSILEHRAGRGYQRQMRNSLRLNNKGLLQFIPRIKSNIVRRNHIPGIIV